MNAYLVNITDQYVNLKLPFHVSKNTPYKALGKPHLVTLNKFLRNYYAYHQKSTTSKQTTIYYKK